MSTLVLILSNIVLAAMLLILKFPPIYFLPIPITLFLYYQLYQQKTLIEQNSEFIDREQTKDDSIVNEQPKINLPELLTIYLVPETHIPGSEILAFLLSHNLQFNEHHIFVAKHDGIEQFFVAGLSSPGTFNLKTISNESFNGLSFFMQPHQSNDALESFDKMCQVIFEAKDKFKAILKSKNQEQINLDQFREWRAELKNEQVMA